MKRSPLFEAAYLERLNRARELWRKPPEERLRWVLEFAREDLAAVGRPGRIERGDALRFISPENPHEGWGGATTLATMSDEQLTRLQAEIRDGVKRLLVYAGRWELPLPSRAHVFRRTPPEQKTALIGLGWDADDRTRILFGVADLLIKHGARLRGCKRCGAAFLARKRQEFCEPECGQRFRDEKKARARRGARRRERRPR